MIIEALILDFADEYITTDPKCVVLKAFLDQMHNLPVELHDFLNGLVVVDRLIEQAKLMNVADKQLGLIELVELNRLK